MIETLIVRQIVSYIPVANELEDALSAIQNRGYKVLSVTETKVNKIPGLTDQAFIILYETGEEDEGTESI